MSTMVEPPHVVIAGGGFAGLYAARSLRTAPVKVTIVDRRNHTCFNRSCATFPNGHMGRIIAIDRVERSIIIRDAESSDSIRISMTDNNRMMSQLMRWSVSNSVFVQYEDRDGGLFATEIERLQ